MMVSSGPLMEEKEPYSNISEIRSKGRGWDQTDVGQ